MATPSHHLSELFSLRLWQEPRDTEPDGVRIQVRHVLSRETYYFRQWPAAIAYMTAKLGYSSDTESKEDAL